MLVAVYKGKSVNFKIAEILYRFYRKSQLTNFVKAIKSELVTGIREFGAFKPFWTLQKCQNEQ